MFPKFLHQAFFLNPSGDFPINPFTIFLAHYRRVPSIISPAISSKSLSLRNSFRDPLRKYFHHSTRYSFKNSTLKFSPHSITIFCNIFFRNLVRSSFRKYSRNSVRNYSTKFYEKFLYVELTKTYFRFPQ